MIEAFSDEDVSASGSGAESEDLQEEHSDDLPREAEGSESEQDGEQDGGPQQQQEQRRQQAAPSAASEQEALLAGELTTEGAVLQLEASELLAETRVEYAVLQPAVDQAFAQLRKAVAAIPEHTAGSGDVAGFLQSLGLPAELSLAFKPPTSVTVIGSYALHAMARPCSTVDVAVQIPRSCLLQKDNLNYRYHGRRALYLSVLARHLASAHPSLRHQQMAALQGDPTRPVLLIHLPTATPKAAGSSTAGAAASSATGSTGVCLRLMPVLAQDAFPLQKLAPDRNNVRWVAKAVASKAAAAGQGAEDTAAARSGGEASSSGQQPQQQKQGRQQQQGKQQQAQKQQQGRQGQQAPQQDQEEGDTKQLPTPHYNAALLQDMLALGHHTHLSAAFSRNPKLIDGLLLLKAWARQCGAYGPADGVDGHLLACLLAHFAQAHPLGAVMTALQLLRMVLRELGAGAMGPGKPLVMARAAGASAGTGAAPALAVFKKQYAAVFVDTTGWLNLAAHVSRSALQHLQACAKHTLAALERPTDADAAFAGCFLSPAGTAGSYDYCWSVTLPEGSGDTDRSNQAAAAAHGGGGTGVSRLLASDLGDLRSQEAAVEKLVRQALGDRASLVHAIPRPLNPMPVSPSAGAAGSLAHGPLKPKSAEVLVCARLDPLQALRLVDVGPPADDAIAAARFRALWGDRAELRRFADGKISEAVVWQAGPAQRHAVPDSAVTYILKRHMPGCSVTCTATALDQALSERHSDANAAALASRAADAALDKLSKQLRALGDIALKVNSVQPLSPVTRHTAPFYPQPHPLAGGPGAVGPGARLARCLEPIEVAVQLEGSGRWPDDPGAYAKTKAAIGLQLAGALESSYGVRVVGSEECLDVLAEGFAFRLILVSDRDQAMHTKALLASGPHTHGHHHAAHTPPRPLALSWHHGLVSGLEGTNAAFGPSARLAKRWLGAQLLGNHVAPEAVELLVAAAFLAPGPLPPPASRLAGLLRFLQLLARHPWGQKPLVVDPATELSAVQRAQLQRAFDARKASGQAPAMAICTPRDTASGHWTHSRPSAPVLQHLVVLAHRSAALLERLLDGALTQQQQQQQQRQQGRKKRLRQEDEESEGNTADEASRLWMSLFAVPLGDFDALILLRKEALPRADRALPGLPAALAAHVGRAGGSAAGGWDDGGKAAKRQRAAAAGDVLRAVAAGGGEGAEADKQARAILRAFPQQVIASRPPEKLRSELLVGFDPLDPYLCALEDRFGHLATFCADPQGGAPVIGVKWRPEAFVAQPLKLTTAHASLELSMTCGIGGGMGGLKRNDAGGVAGLLVPNVAQVVAEMGQLGAGLVSEVVLCQ